MKDILFFFFATLYKKIVIFESEHTLKENTALFEISKWFRFVNVTKAILRKNLS